MKRTTTLTLDRADVLVIADALEAAHRHLRSEEENETADRLYERILKAFHRVDCAA